MSEQPNPQYLEMLSDHLSQLHRDIVAAETLNENARTPSTRIRAVLEAIEELGRAVVALELIERERRGLA